MKKYFIIHKISDATYVYRVEYDYQKAADKVIELNNTAPQDETYYIIEDSTD